MPNNHKQLISDCHTFLVSRGWRFREADFSAQFTLAKLIRETGEFLHNSSPTWEHVPSEDASATRWEQTRRVREGADPCQ